MNIRLSVFAALLILVVAAPCAQAAQPAAMHVADSCGDANVPLKQPATLNGCGSDQFTQLQWASWGGAVATATGSVKLPACGESESESADCLDATFDVPVTLTLSGSRSCIADGAERRYYTDATAVAPIPAERIEAFGSSEFRTNWSLAACTKPNYLVWIKDSNVHYGPSATYVPTKGDESELDALTRIFGTARTRGTKRCRTHVWPSLGLTINDTMSQCGTQRTQHVSITDGVRSTGWASSWRTVVALSGSRWHLRNGIRPGSSARAARRAAKAACTRKLCGRIKGYAMVVRSQGCGSGEGWSTYWKQPTVIAEVARGRVTRLLIQQRTVC